MEAGGRTAGEQTAQPRAVDEGEDTAGTRTAQGVGNSWNKRVNQLQDSSFSAQIVDPLEYNMVRLWAENRVNKFIKSIRQVIR